MTDLLEKLCPLSAASAAVPHREQRESARQQLLRFGLPGDRIESWKYTSLRPLSLVAMETAVSVPEQALAKLASEVLGTTPAAGVIVLAEGQCLLLNTPDWVHSFATLLEQQPYRANSLLQPDAQVREHASDSFIWMNLACSDHGVVIEVPAQTVVDAPLHIIHADAASVGHDHADAASASHRRVHIHCAQGAKISIIEHFVQGGAGLSNIYRSIELDQQARLDLMQLRAADDRAHMLEHSHVQQQAASSCRLWDLATGGRLMRQEVRCALQGASAGFAHHGLLLGHARRHMDQHVLARHIAANCHSRQLFRSVLANRSRGVINTAASVAAGADGSDVQQHCASILLSPNAEMDAKPQLEILADEVLASHGATIGQLDDEALFYLRSRGLSEPQARSLLLQGFVQTLLETLPEKLRIDAVQPLVQAQLEIML